MVALIRDMTADETTLPVSAAGSRSLEAGFYQLDDEFLELPFGPPANAPSPTDGTPARFVRRGVAGSTKATHSSGAELTRYYPEAPSEAGLPPEPGATPTLEDVLDEGNDADGQRIRHLGAPEEPDDAARLDDIPDQQTLADVLDEGNSAANGRIQDLGAPVDPNDAARLADVGAVGLEDPDASWPEDAGVDEGQRISFAGSEPKLRVFEALDDAATGETIPDFGAVAPGGTIEDGTAEWRFLGFVGELPFALLSTDVAALQPPRPRIDQVLAAGNDADGERITQLADPVDDQDAATKASVAAAIAAIPPASDPSLADVLDVGSSAAGGLIQDLGAPVDPNDSARKAYVDAGDALAIARADAVWRIEQDGADNPFNIRVWLEDGTNTAMSIPADATEATIQADFFDDWFGPGRFLIAGDADDFTVTCIGVFSGQRLRIDVLAGGPG